MTQPSGDRLAMLYRISQTFSSTLDLREVLNRVMDEVVAVTRAERGFIMLRGQDGSLAFRAARGIAQKSIEEPEFQISRGIVERVAVEGRPLLTSDAQLDPQLGGRASVRLLGLRAVMCVPLVLKGTILGAVYVDSRLQSGVFSPDDLELLAGIASSAAIAIDNARLYEVAVEKGRMERELQVAREVQASLIPQHSPQVPGWEFAGWWHPAREVSGDFYDFLTFGDNHTGLVIGDVTDKGMPAALFMASARSIVRACAAAATDPLTAVRAANATLCAETLNGMFITLCLAHLEPASGRMAYVNAGHNPPLHWVHNTKSLQPFARPGLPLGIEPTAAYAEGVADVEPGDVVLLYTDGVTDATNLDSQLFGLDRLQRVLAEHAESPAVELRDHLRSALDEFIGPSTPYDDVTFLIARRAE
ncbi:MAG TPA: GAF domain-containing SpoIIE family protein phosphatase [Anaerolineales bacterium]|nr:GAF domain-containing SpoIIE family protein phosphatase [Anaerolineales bacterium]